LRTAESINLLRVAIFCLQITFLAPKRAFALDPAAPVTEYIRTNFTVENGLPSNVVNAVLQTRNGFLWVGTDAGLVRFDGRQFTPIPLRTPESGSPGIVTALAEAPNGDLWVGTETGLARIDRPALDFFDRSQLRLYDPGLGVADEIRSLLFTHDGLLWVGTNGGVFRYEQDRFARVSGVEQVLRMTETARAHPLIATDGGIREWDGSRLLAHPEVETALKLKGNEIFDALEDGAGTVWYCSMHGLSRKQNGSWKHLCWNDFATQAYQDSRGTIWTHLATGFYRLKEDRFEQISTNAVRAIAEDRDGDLWIGTNGDGLVRFKDRTARMFTKAQGLPNDVVMTVLVRKDGTLWAGNNCGGLSRFDGERFHTYTEKDGLTNSCIWSLAEDHNQNLWIGTWGGGLFELANNHFLHFAERQGLPSDVVRGLQVAHDGSLWIAADGGVSHMVNGHIKTYTTENGLSSPHVLSIFEDRQRTIWAATTKGINRLVKDVFQPVSTPREISDPRLSTFGEDSSHNLYALDAPKGVDLLVNGRFSNLVADLDLFSLVTVKNRLWLSGGNGLVSIDTASLLAANSQGELPLNLDHFGVDDGFASQQCSIGFPNIALATNGTLWVATVKGLVRLETNEVHPSTENLPTLISDVTVDRTKRVAGRNLALPPGPHHIELHFDAISLKSPEKVNFQYWMEGVDSTWLEPTNTLTAVYSNLPVGRHVFHVRSSNSDGVWDPAGITYPITQEPFVYQTAWFRAAAVSLLLAVSVFAYLRRLRQLDLQYKALMDERVAERTRIARDLHDTLLQSFQGLLFRFQAAANLLPQQPGAAKESLDSTIGRAAQAITEARSAVEELRSSPENTEGLVALLKHLGQDLAAEQSGASQAESIDFQVVVEGVSRPLNYALKEDLFRIAAEALRNAFRHARAKQIEVEVRYDVRAVRVRVRDDGAGMDPAVLSDGNRAGHWGLPGMRERARSIGARFDLWSHPGGGTEVEILVPAHVAYTSDPVPEKGK
jgi:signal transduction histidine kinase/ligand-binding sensor domain-containing protein